MQSTASDFQPVMTKAALLMQAKAKQFQAVVFEEPKFTREAPKFGKGHITLAKDDADDAHNKARGSAAKDDNEFDIKRARHEVLNFAMSNQRREKNQKKMQIFQLVKLGAKPPKKKSKNYKELLAERKRLKDIREERQKFHQLGKNQTGAASVKCRSKTKIEKQQKKRAPVSNIDQHYGVAKPKFKKKK